MKLGGLDGEASAMDDQVCARARGSRTCRPSPLVEAPLPSTRSPATVPPPPQIRRAREKLVQHEAALSNLPPLERVQQQREAARAVVREHAAATKQYGAKRRKLEAEYKQRQREAQQAKVKMHNLQVRGVHVAPTLAPCCRSAGAHAQTLAVLPPCWC